MNFLLGCNYWDSAHGTKMWEHFDEEVIREDMKALSENGIRQLRVFPNWKDFQPVKRLYRWCNMPGDCVTADTEQPLYDRSGVDPQQIANFRRFAKICDEYGISLMVSVVTGWMSGRVLVPQLLDGKNLISDPEALMWTARFIRSFVSGVKDLPNILMWDLGNECNCLSPAKNRAEAFVWTAFVRNAIRAEDPTRPICSGMHGLTSGEEDTWNLADQGELTDYITTHPYISPSVNNDYDPPNQMRSTIFPTAQSMFYQDLSGKPVIIQEQGTFTDTTANPEMAADFARVNVLSCISHNIKGYYWWCAHEHILLDFAPYSWSLMERSLGMLDLDRKPKPVGKALCEVSNVIKQLPFEELPQHITDAVCVLTENDRWENGSVAFVLAKQAGIDVRFSMANVSNVNIPEAPMYLVPGVVKWAVMYKHSWDSLKSQVYDNGATMLVTYDGGSLIELESVFGLRSNGNVKSQSCHTSKFSFGELSYHVNQELLLESVGAQVLAVNEENNPVFTCNRYGKGKVYFLNMPLEKNLSTKARAFTNTDWYKIYKTAASDVLTDRIVVSENPQIGITLHKESEDRYIVCAINYSDKDQENSFTVREGWELRKICGSLNQISKCNGAFYYAVRK